MVNSYCQTIISQCKQNHERVRSTQLFPLVDSLDSDRIDSRKSYGKEATRVGMKRDT